jgi:hypothetical protein
MVVASVPVFRGLAVERMSVQVVPLGEDCQFTITPICPARLIVVPEPLHTVAAAAVALPPTEGGVTVTVARVESADEHPPLVTLAR